MRVFDQASVVTWNSAAVAPGDDIDLGGGLVLKPFSVNIRRVADRGSQMSIDTLVQCVEGRGEIPIEFAFPPPMRRDPRERAHEIKHAIMQMLEHEVDECLRFVDGTHVTNPHPEGLPYRGRY